MIGRVFTKEYRKYWRELGVEYKHYYHRTPKGSNIYFRFWLKGILVYTFAWGESVPESGGYKRCLKPQSYFSLIKTV